MAPSAVTPPVLTSSTLTSKVTSRSNPVELEDASSHSLVLRTFRVLIADLVQQFNGGHPGGAMGMAAIGIALWRYSMKYSPSHPDWFNRDRFILSNGKCNTVLETLNSWQAGSS